MYHFLLVWGDIEGVKLSLLTALRILQMSDDERNEEGVGRAMQGNMISLRNETAVLSSLQSMLQRKVSFILFIL